MTPISKEPTIRAFGLETRYWKHDPENGYACAECCNGDRCDEDCTAKYKGNRAGCPHCKGKGWIKAEDLDPALSALSKELSKQIEREARLYAKSHGHKEIGFSSLAYEAGATAYAHYKERFEQAKKAIEAFKITFNDKSKSAIDLYKEMDNLFEALASWKEEGKDASAPVDGPRGSGYYKVRLHGNWIIAEYFNYVEGGNHWYVCGNETSFADQDFQQIGERLL